MPISQPKDSTLSDFPDRKIVEHLRAQLWQRKPGRVAGRAAVMIGAGFSRNAERVASSARPFPDWAQLMRPISEALYPGVDIEKTAPGTSGALRLAQEYEATFGRSALEEVIDSTIPDAEHRPGSLHGQLLSLPWSDIFTTNWDTLLERARLDVAERLYDVVLTPSQIPAAAVPRIVKLHGTLAARTPIIVSEEDYRTYPARFAPFLNMAQQSIIENAFVLLGFSGDDPNFLAWSGWVRDNLGTHAPRIYLVGYLHLSPGRRRLLEERNVVPVDLAGLPQAATWPSDMQHRFATEWFLHSLEAGRPPRAGEWPKVTAPAKPPPSYLGEILPPVSAGTVAEPWPNLLNRPPSAGLPELTAATEAWRTNRRAYPGWQVAPGSVRSRLWEPYIVWMDNVSQVLRAANIRDRWALLGEILWRLETCLIEIDVVPDLVATVQDSLERVDLVQRLVEVEDGSVEPLAAEEVFGVRLTLRALARLARRAGEEAVFGDVLQTMLDAFSADAEVRHEVRYERILWHLQRSEYRELEAALASWDVEAADPNWGLRKAGILLEINRMDEAALFLRGAFARLRRERRRDVEDPASLSKEGWGLWLTGAWPRRGQAPEQSWDMPDANDRWRDLTLQDCNAMADYRGLLSDLNERPRTSGARRKRGFNVGSHATSISGHSGIATDMRAALQMRRLAEVTGIPAAANGVQLIQEGLSLSVEKLVGPDPFPSALHVLRIAGSESDKLIDLVFRRARVATFSDKVVDGVMSAASNALDYGMPRSRKPEDRHQFWYQRFNVALQVLSRVTLRAPVDKVLLVLQRAEALYEARLPIADPRTAGGVSDLFHRCIEALPTEALRAQLPRLLALSLIPIGDHGRWTDPAEHVRRLRQDVINSPPDRSAADWSRIVDRILRAVTEAEADRQPAIARLLLIRDLGLLDANDEARVIRLIWGEGPYDEAELPHSLGLSPWAFLVQPEPAPGVAAAAFRRAFLCAPRRRPLPAVLYNVGFALWQTRLRGKPFVLDETDDAVIRELVREWASRPIVQRSPFAPLLMQEDHEAETGLGLLLTERRLDGADLQALWERTVQTEEAGFSAPYVLFPGLAQTFPDRAENLLHRLRRGLSSSKPDVVEQAFYGLYRWVEAGSAHAEVPAVPDDLIAEVGVAVAARRHGATAIALELARWVFNEGPVHAGELIAANCEVGLTYLLSEATYEAELQNGETDAPDAAMLRRGCVRLALAMNASGSPPGPGSIAWLEAARTDPLPEVRRLVEEHEAGRPSPIPEPEQGGSAPGGGGQDAQQET
jgi:hypothetical protein